MKVVVSSNDREKRSVLNNHTMDFASLMSKEISQAKPTTTSTAEEKYLKRAEVAKQREAAYFAEQEASHAAKAEKASKKRELELEETERTRVREEKRARLAEESKKRRNEEEVRAEHARRKRLGLPDPAKVQETTPASEGAGDLDDADLDSKLRQMGEPIRLFGETHKQRLRRYRRFTSAPRSGFTSLQLVPEEDMKVDKVPSDVDGKRYLYRQLASYFTMVLKEWESALESRPLEVKESFQGKAASNALAQSKENMKPLFHRFEKGELDILDAVVEIVKAAQERRYVDANDAYLTLSIGKA